MNLSEPIARPARPPSALWWILGGALALRLLLLLLWEPPLTSDSLDYDRLATSLATGGGYVNTEGLPTSWRPPLYPAFLAAVYTMGGESGTARWIQALVDVGSVAVVVSIASSLFGAREALVAGALVAVNLAQIAATGRVLSETIFTLLLLAAVRVTMVVEDDLSTGKGGARTLGRAALAGALLGLGTLTRGILILFPPLVAAALWGPGARLSRRGAVVTTLVLAFVAILTPWALRNREVHGKLVPVATQSGITLYGSYFPPEDRLFGILPQDETTAIAESLPEAEADAYLTHRTVERVMADPGRLPRLTLLKALYFWVPLDWEILPVYGALNATYVLIVLLGGTCVALGGWRPWGRRGVPGPATPAWPVWLPVAYLFGMSLLFYGSPRMRLPAEPLLAVFAGGGFVLLEDRVGRKTARWAIAGTALVLALATVAGGPLKRAVAALLSAVGIW